MFGPPSYLGRTLRPEAERSDVAWWTRSLVCSRGHIWVCLGVQLCKKSADDKDDLIDDAVSDSGNQDACVTFKFRHYNISL